MEKCAESNGTLDTNYTYDGRTYTYTDKTSNKTFLWDTEVNKWIEKNEENWCHVSHSASKIHMENKSRKSKTEDDEDVEEDTDDEQEKPKPRRQDMSQGLYGYEGDTYTFTDATDGTMYFWDKEKNAWFPKIDNDFIAYYQMSYGFTAPVETVPEQNKDKCTAEIRNNDNKTMNPDADPNPKRKLATESPKWFDIDDQHNTKVYVSNLPLDITETEFVDVMQKCGLVMKDVDTGKMKVKLYTDPEAKTFKGDALCTYIKKESVALALNLLDGYDLRGYNIKVEKARFTMKGNAYDPNLKPKKRRKKDKDKIKKMQERLFSWQPDKLRGERPKHERVVVIKNLFEPSVFDENLSLILEYRQDLREECVKCGSVKKVVLYDKHPDGVAQVWFKEAEAADACIQLLNNRWFSKRLIIAEMWDGKTKYKIEETPVEQEARIKKWEDFLNSNKKNSNTESEELKMPIIDNESDGTRSSAGSGDETDEEKIIESQKVTEKN